MDKADMHQELIIISDMQMPQKLLRCPILKSYKLYCLLPAKAPCALLQHHVSFFVQAFT